MQKDLESLGSASTQGDSMDQILARRIFTESDQIIFGKFSGDINPIHLDEVEARKRISGQRVVHGIHGMLWALESLAGVGGAVSSLRAQFIKPVFLNEEVVCRWLSETQELVLTVAGLICSRFTLELTKETLFFSGDISTERSGLYAVHRSVD